MISLQEFLKENLIFIMVPVVLGVITIIHDFVPTWLFLGGGFALLGVFVVSNQSVLDAKKNVASEDTLKKYEKEFEKADRKAANKKRRAEEQKERQRLEKQRAVAKKQAVDQKTKASKYSQEEVLPEKKTNNKARKAAAREEESEDEGDDGLLRLAAMQKRR